MTSHLTASLRDSASDVTLGGLLQWCGVERPGHTVAIANEE